MDDQAVKLAEGEIDAEIAFLTEQVEEMPLDATGPFTTRISALNTRKRELALEVREASEKMTAEQTQIAELEAVVLPEGVTIKDLEGTTAQKLATAKLLAKVTPAPATPDGGDPPAPEIDPAVLAAHGIIEPGGEVMPGAGGLPSLGDTLRKNIGGHPGEGKVRAQIQAMKDHIAGAFGVGENQ